MASKQHAMIPGTRPKTTHTFKDSFFQFQTKHVSKKNFHQFQNIDSNFKKNKLPQIIYSNFKKPKSQVQNPQPSISKSHIQIFKNNAHFHKISLPFPKK